ncbi:MAG: cytochrome c [Gemmataceae bacterium]|nr:cytochrome c [Gemmataceae bacterium]
MTRGRRLKGITCVATVTLAVLSVRAWTQDSREDDYRPVAPPAALRQALVSQLNVVQDWLKDQDQASAAQSAQGLLALARLLEQQSSDRSWREQTARLVQACDRVRAAAQAGQGGEAMESVKQCAAILQSLEKVKPAGNSAPVSGFKLSGSTKTWMLLMDGAYVDAKSAKTASELEQLALALAEEANAVGHLRADPRWRQMSRAVRDAALQSAAGARSNDLTAARKALKGVYERCEACHQGYR